MLSPSRELLDEHFRTASHDLSEEQLWSLSEKLTQLGKMLSDLKLTLDFPEIKELGIKGGGKTFSGSSIGISSSVFGMKNLGMRLPYPVTSIGMPIPCL